MFLEKTDTLLIFGVLLSQLIRWSVSRWPYSGAGKPPMYGDYEAQRHWMEITVNLPVTEWYKNSTNNDLLYWGLDYPPLTAYQSMLFGYLAKWINPSWVALNTSRGFESYEHKIFMRSTVAGLDLLLFYVPVILYWTLCARPVKLRDKGLAASLTLLYPGLILIDHGHFQYNCVSLGFTLFAVLSMMLHYDVLGAVFFTLSLHYKQMTLYYSLPFFSYLLGTCFQLPLQRGIIKFLKLSMAVLATTAVCWAPFLTSSETFVSVLSRLFPVGRGLYEDKVANIWCVLSIVFKFKQRFSTATTLQISAIATFLSILPSSYDLFRKPSVHKLRIALVNSSLVFFLFSYQVHEKSILFAAVASFLLIEDHPFVCCWFAYISTFSLVPLLGKEGLIVPYFSLCAMFICGVIRAYNGMGLSFQDRKSLLKTAAFILSVLASILLIVAMFKVKQPKRYPHLHVLLNCAYSCVHFVGFSLYFHYLQFTEKPWSLYTPKRKVL